MDTQLNRGVNNYVAIISLAFGLICAGAPVISGAHPQALISKEKAADDKAKTVIHMTVEQLLRRYPLELNGVNVSLKQDELDSLLQKVGERVEAFFLNFPNTNSKENVLLERLKPNGKTEASLRQSYDYMVQVYPDQTGMGLEEDRRASMVSQGKQVNMIGYCLTSGYTGTPILFHPRHQSSSNYRYLGRQSVEPRSHVIAFAQKAEAGSAIGAFRTDARSKSTPMFYQGLVWVDPQTYQIVRMRTDLLTPLPEQQLSAHTTEVSFGEVHFSSISQAFWLPQKVLVTIRWKGKIYRNLHRYFDYRLFSVQSFDKVEQPRAKKAG